MAVKPENLPAHVRSLYRLRPDRRFLYAAAELQRLTTGGARRGVLAIRFEESRWRLSLDGSSLGDLPEFPAFADARGLLLSQLRAQPAFKGTSGADPLGAAGRAAIESGPSADLFPALARLDAAWKASPGDPALAGAALRGLLWATLQTFDELELSDPILGKALALFAIAESGQPGHFAREECLLASMLGYEDHARLVARGLPADDPVRLFADWDLAGLKALAHRPQPEPRTEYLYLLRLAENQTNNEAWFREFEASSWGRKVDGAGLRLVLRLDPFGLRTLPATLMESQVLEDVSLVSHAAGGSAMVTGGRSWSEVAARQLQADRESGQHAPVNRLQAFEDAVNREALRLDGSLLDGQVVRSFRLANFYSSVYSAAGYYFDSLGSTDGAEAFGNSLANPPAGTAAELKDWILHRVRLRRSSVEGVRAVAADLSRLRHIGMAPLNRISYSVRISSSGQGDLVGRAHVRGYFEGLDSRPSNLHAAFRTASELLNDLAIEEQCMRLATERGPREVSNDLPWALRVLGDRERLGKLAEDKTWPLSIRSSALEELAGLEVIDLRMLVDRFRGLFREDPTGSGPLRAAVGILEKQEQVESALQLIDEWLKAHAERDLTWAGVSSLKSRLLRKQGRLQEALEVAQVAAETRKADCLEEEALVLIDLGRLDEALETAMAALDQYGGDSEAALAARILWMKGRDDEAARLLTSPQRRLSSNAWNAELPAAFDKAFKKSDGARAEAAFLKLVVPSVPTLNVVWFIERLTKSGREDLALRLCERVRGRGPAGWVTVAAYRAMRKAQGAAAARAWLGAHATPADLDVFAKQALVEADYELVWDLPDHPDPTKNEILQLVRAACLLYQPGSASDERRAGLVTFFEGRPKKDFVAYGLFLLGRSDRPTLFAQIKDATYVCSVGWILGLTSVREKRYEEANAWLQVSMEAGVSVPPRFWAAAILTRWSVERCVLAEVARKGIY